MKFDINSPRSFLVSVSLDWIFNGAKCLVTLLQYILDIFLIVSTDRHLICTDILLIQLVPYIFRS